MNSSFIFENIAESYTKLTFSLVFNVYQQILWSLGDRL